MNKKVFFLWTICATLLLGSCKSTQFTKAVEDILNEVGANSGKVSESEVGQGLKQALEFGITKGSDVLSKKDGYLKNSAVKILLPPEVQKVESTIRSLGLGNLADEAITLLNRAAEDAASAAKPIFISAIKQLTFKDVMNILKGKQNAATDFLRRTTTQQLYNTFKPSIKTSLNKVGADQKWTKLTTEYNKLPIGKDIKNTDLSDYVTNKALEGLFLMVEKEEAKIRKDPIARTTDLLKRVFKLQDSK